MRPSRLPKNRSEQLPVSRTPSLGVIMEPEVGYGTAQTICSGVQARGGETGVKPVHAVWVC